MNAADRFGPKMAIGMLPIVLVHRWRFKCCQSFWTKAGDLNAAHRFNPTMWPKDGDLNPAHRFNPTMWPKDGDLNAADRFMLIHSIRNGSIADLLLEFVYICLHVLSGE